MSYISEAIKPVFQPNQGRVNRANELLNTYSNDTPTLLEKLGELCRCTFLDNAKLYYRTPTAAESKEISDSYVTKGDSIPDNMAVETLVGSTTMPADPVKKFYSCTSLDDTSPTLIASSSTTLSGKEESRKQCNDWAFLTEFTSVSSKITTGTNDDSVYVSISSTGGCFNAVGGLKTLPVYIQSSPDHWRFIPALEVVCSGSSCSTVSSPEIIYGTSPQTSFIIPPMTISCSSSNVCTTPITVVSKTDDLPLTIPSLTVGFISPAAGSLFSLCMYETDN
jgi:hypothetical protein